MRGAARPSSERSYGQEAGLGRRGRRALRYGRNSHTHPPTHPTHPSIQPASHPSTVHLRIRPCVSPLSARPSVHPPVHPSSTLVGDRGQQRAQERGGARGGGQEEVAGRGHQCLCEALAKLRSLPEGSRRARHRRRLCRRLCDRLCDPRAQVAAVLRWLTAMRGGLLRRVARALV